LTIASKQTTLYSTLFYCPTWSKSIGC